MASRRTRMTRTASQNDSRRDEASCAVFSSYELVVEILQFVPMHSLIVLQRTNRTFFYICQPLLFNTPVNDAKQLRPFYRHAVHWNGRPTNFDDDESRPGKAKIHQPNELLQTYFPNFFRDFRCGSNTVIHDGNWEDQFQLESEIPLPWAENEQTREKFLRANASWRRMLLTQPPIESLQIIRKQMPDYQSEYDPDDGCYHSTNIDLSKDNDVRTPVPEASLRGQGGCEGSRGLRMGLLYDAVEEAGRAATHSWILMWHQVPILDGCARRMANVCDECAQMDISDVPKPIAARVTLRLIAGRWHDEVYSLLGDVNLKSKGARKLEIKLEKICDGVERRMVAEVASPGKNLTRRDRPLNYCWAYEPMT